MANEGRVNSNLQIRKGNLTYQSQPTSFQFDVSGSKGPTPGAITVSIAGTDIDLSELTILGMCRIMNLDETNYIRVGIWDGVSLFPLARVSPGKFFIFELDRDIGQEYGTGTGTTGTGINRLRIKATVAPCNVLVEAFEA